MDRRRIALVSGVVVFVLLIIGLLLAFARPGYTPSRTYAVPTSLSTSAPYGNDAMVFSNGRSFVEYNYKAGKTKLLSPNTVLPGLDNIDSLSASADKQYLLFHSSKATLGGTPSNILFQRGLDPVASYWWVYDVQNQTFNPLPQEVTVARMSGSNLYTLHAKNSLGYITTYALSGLQKTASMSVPQSDNFLVAKNGFLLHTPENSVLQTTDGVVNTQLFTNTTLNSITKDGTVAVGQQTIKNKQELVALDLQQATSTDIASDVTGTPTSLNSGTVFYTTSNGGGTPNFYTYDLATKKYTHWSLPSYLNDSSFKSSALLSSNVIVTASDSGDCYISGENLANVPSVAKGYYQSLIVDNTAVTVKYSSDNHAFLIGLDTNETDSQQAAVYKQLQKDGYDPYFFTVR